MKVFFFTSILFLAFHSVCWSQVEEPVFEEDQEDTLRLDEVYQITSFHRTFAVLPFRVSIAVNDFKGLKVAQLTPEKVQRLSQLAGREAQGNFARWLLKRKFRAKIQDTLKTCQLLFSNGIQIEDLAKIEISTLCSILGTDGLVLGRIHHNSLLPREFNSNRDRDHSPATNYASGIFDVKHRTYRQRCEIILCDCKMEQSIWTMTNLQVEQFSYLNFKESQLSMYLKYVAKRFPYQN